MNNHLLMSEDIKKDIETKEAVCNKWEQYGLLAGIPKNMRIEVAQILENQRLLDEHEHQDAKYKRLSIPIVRHSLGRLAISKLFSLQSQPFQTDDKSYYLTLDVAEDGGTWLEKHEVELSENILRVNASFAGPNVNGLDEESEATILAADEVKFELDRKIINHVRVNAPTRRVWNFEDALGDTIKEKMEGLYLEISGMSREIGGEGESPNWIVTSPEIASLLQVGSAFAPRRSDEFSAHLGIHHEGTLNMRWKVYTDPLMPTGTLILGYKGESNYDAGLFFVPSTMLNRLDKNRLMAKYAIAMPHPEYYGVLNVVNFVF